MSTAMRSLMVVHVQYNFHRFTLVSFVQVNIQFAGRFLSGKVSEMVWLVVYPRKVQ